MTFPCRFPRCGVVAALEARERRSAPSFLLAVGGKPPALLLFLADDPEYDPAIRFILLLGLDHQAGLAIAN